MPRKHYLVNFTIDPKDETTKQQVHAWLADMIQSCNVGEIPAFTVIPANFDEAKADDQIKTNVA